MTDVVVRGVDEGLWSDFKYVASKTGLTRREALERAVREWCEDSGLLITHRPGRNIVRKK